MSYSDDSDVANAVNVADLKDALGRGGNVNALGSFGRNALQW